jgi:hypothetical protein
MKKVIGRINHVSSSITFWIVKFPNNFYTIDRGELNNLYLIKDLLVLFDF